MELENMEIHSTKTDIFDGRYFKRSKRFMQIIGLWPYQSQYVRLIIKILYYTINLSLAVPQAILLAKVWGKNFNITMENIASVLFTTICVMKYVVTFSCSSKLNTLFLQIADDWQRITDKEERKILIKHCEEGRILVILYSIYMFFAWLIYTSLPFAPLFLDYAFPLKNKTRPLLMPFYADYVILEQDDYHYMACGHISVVYFTSFFLFSGIDGIYVLTVKHTCGMFDITGDRIDKMLGSKKCSESITRLNDDTVIYNNLRSAVTLHNDTIRCFNLLEDSFNKCFMVVQFLCVILTSMCGVYLIFIFKEDKFTLFRVSAFMFGVFMHLLYLNWIGQQLIDSSEQIFNSTYCSSWYLISTKARKFTRMIMCRARIPCQLTAGKLSVLSIESFGILLKTSMSYFTVLLSVI